VNIWQIQDWAKQQDEDEPEFILLVGKGGIFNGKFIDKGLGFVQIPATGEGIISLMHLQKESTALDFDFMSIEGKE
jgi:hypothetical protein